MYICMALGFEGKYRVIDRGEVELNNIKDSLFRQIKIVKGRDPYTFYTSQEPSKDKYRLLIKYLILFFSQGYFFFSHYLFNFNFNLK